MNAKEVAGGVIGGLTGYTTGIKACLSLSAAGVACTLPLAVDFGVVGVIAGVLIGSLGSEKVLPALKSSGLEPDVPCEGA